MKNHGKLTFRGLISKSSFVALALGAVLTGCKDSEFDEYYERPGWLDKPAVDVLKGRGDCSNYMQLVEKTLFAKQLEGSGSYTFFVPNDAAFQAFFADNPYGYRSVADIPDDVAADIVSSLMLYNQYPCDSIGRILDGYNTWRAGVGAYKHQTPAYDILSRGYYNGDSVWVFDDYGAWTQTWHNYRYLPVFTEYYFKNNALETSDYMHFFPGSTWSKYGNVLGAQVQEISGGSGDLYCENGVIHIIDKVVMPLRNLDRMVQEYPEQPADMPAEAQGGAWSFMKHLVNFQIGDGTYAFLSYDEDIPARHYYEDVYPDYDLTKLYRRGYNVIPMLNIESYPSFSSLPRVVEGDDSYTSGYTLFLPTQSVMEQYIANRVLAYVDHNGWNESQTSFNRVFNQLSVDVLYNLYYSLFANGIVWPSDFENSQNLVTTGVGKEYVNGGRSGFSFDSEHFQSSAFASNGLYHITRFVPQTAAFEGVASRMLLDPNYAGMLRVFGGNLTTSTYNHMLYSELGNYGQVNFNVVYDSDALLAKWGGINYDAIDGRFELSDGTDVNSGMNTLATMGFVQRDTTDVVDFEVDPLDGAYGGWTYVNSTQGNVIRYKKSGATVSGKPEIMVQSYWNIQNDPAEKAVARDASDTRYWLPYDEDNMPQTKQPTAGTYASVIKDPTYGSYLNGNVYTATEQSAPLYFPSAIDINGNSFDGGSVWSLYETIDHYLATDSAQAVPCHSIFKKYWEHAKTAGSAPSIGSGYHTVLIPTDAALQKAIILGMMVDPDYMATMDANTEAHDYNYHDTAAYYVNAYIVTTDVLPDDGASTLYSGNLWDCPNVTIDMGSNGFVVTTKCAPMSDEWEDLMSGTTRMSMYLSKLDGVGQTKNRMQFLGRIYQQGSMSAVAAVNASELFPGEFDNCVERELGQSNIIGPNGVIHSLNGFILYQVLENPAKK